MERRDGVCWFPPRNLPRLLSAGLASLSLTAEMSVRGNGVTPALLETVGDENDPANNRRAQLLLDDANLHII